MKQNGPQHSLGLVALLLTFTPACSGHLSERANTEPQADTAAIRTTQTFDATEKVPGMVVHIDPKTGRIISPPSAGVLPGQFPPPLDTTRKLSPEPSETISPLPGGGVSIQLDDRFMSPLTATIDADSKLKLEHIRSNPALDEKQE
jgi:hypothetical protein